MQRRTFIKNTALSAVAVSASGFVHFDGNRYVGDCETTTDILGPFYRPDSPLRNNLEIIGEPGSRVELSGFIKHRDCTTPYKKAKIELWHCSSTGVYDNSSNQFRYRGTTYSNDEGHYSFNTVLPVPYEAGGGRMRPAHFHLMISAEGYPALITQLYFSGDTYITTDLSSSAPTAKRRILEVQTLNDKTKKVLFDVSMSDTLAAEPSAIDKLTGVYTDDQNKETEFFKKNNVLWRKNEVFGVNLEYTGNNTFQYPGLPAGIHRTYHFEIMASGSIKLTQTDNYLTESGQDLISVAVKKK